MTLANKLCIVHAMHVALCHNALIPPPKYGGTERVIYWLATALNKLGHKTTIVAAPGSEVPGSNMVIHTDDWLSKTADADILHLWATPSTLPSKPFVVTIEGNGQPDETFHPNTLFISRKHAENHGATEFVYNGLDPNDYQCSRERGDSLVFLAKASWSVKNLEGAIAVARKARMPLEVLGSRDWPLSLHRLLPRIRGVKYHGMVGDAEKRAVLARARGLLFPVRWHEPFGIAVTEALASGCPVYATPYGSLPEIVSSDVGFLSNNGAELVRALTSGQNYSAESCRKLVIEKFSYLDMARAYLGYYERVLRTGSIVDKPGDKSQEPIRTLSPIGLSAKHLLPWSNPT